MALPPFQSVLFTTPPEQPPPRRSMALPPPMFRFKPALALSYDAASLTPLPLPSLKYPTPSFTSAPKPINGNTNETNPKVPAVVGLRKTSKTPNTSKSEIPTPLSVNPAKKAQVPQVIEEDHASTSNIEVEDPKISKLHQNRQQHKGYQQINIVSSSNEAGPVVSVAQKAAFGNDKSSSAPQYTQLTTVAERRRKYFSKNASDHGKQLGGQSSEIEEDSRPIPVKPVPSSSTSDQDDVVQIPFTRKTHTFGDRSLPPKIVEGFVTVALPPIKKKTIAQNEQVSNYHENGTGEEDYHKLLSRKMPVQPRHIGTVPDTYEECEQPQQQEATESDVEFISSRTIKLHVPQKNQNRRKLNHREIECESNRKFANGQFYQPAEASVNNQKRSRNENDDEDYIEVTVKKIRPKKPPGPRRPKIKEDDTCPTLEALIAASKKQRECVPPEEITLDDDDSSTVANPNSGGKQDTIILVTGPPNPSEQQGTSGDYCNFSAVRQPDIITEEDMLHFPLFEDEEEVEATSAPPLTPQKPQTSSSLAPPTNAPLNPSTITLSTPPTSTQTIRLVNTSTFLPANSPLLPSTSTPSTSTPSFPATITLSFPQSVQVEHNQGNVVLAENGNQFRTPYASTIHGDHVSIPQSCKVFSIEKMGGDGISRKFLLPMAKESTIDDLLNTVSIDFTELFDTSLNPAAPDATTSGSIQAPSNFRPSNGIYSLHHTRTFVNSDGSLEEAYILDDTAEYFVDLPVHHQGRPNVVVYGQPLSRYYVDASLFNKDPSEIGKPPLKWNHMYPYTRKRMEDGQLEKRKRPKPLKKPPPPPPVPRRYVKILPRQT